VPAAFRCALREMIGGQIPPRGVRSRSLRAVAESCRGCVPVVLLNLLRARLGPPPVHSRSLYRAQPWPDWEGRDRWHHRPRRRLILVFYESCAAPASARDRRQLARCAVDRVQHDDLEAQRSTSASSSLSAATRAYCMRIDPPRVELLFRRRPSSQGPAPAAPPRRVISLNGKSHMSAAMSDPSIPSRLATGPLSLIRPLRALLRVASLPRPTPSTVCDQRASRPARKAAHSDHAATCRRLSANDHSALANAISLFFCLPGAPSAIAH
jgi:hypothetical protein